MSSRTGAGAKNLLVTGRPGVGKTTLVQEIARRLEEEDLVVRGFYTTEVREGGRRCGFDIVDLYGGRGRLARVGAEGPRVGRYGVCVEDLEEVAVRSVERALDDERCAVVLLDEVGRMELVSRAFREVVTRALDSPKPLLATIKAGSDPFTRAVRRRNDVDVVEVTQDNRDDLVDAVRARVVAACCGS